MINPIFKNTKSVVIYLSIWFSIILFQTQILFFVIKLPFYESVIDSLVFNILYLLLALSFWYPAKYISFESFSVLRILSNHITTAFVSSGVWIIICYWILKQLFNGDENYNNFLLSSLVWRFFIGMLFYFIIVSLIYVIIYYSNFQDKVLNEAKLNSLVKEAELKSLKYQLNPHFIFNSLNSISALTISSPESARKMTINLSSFLRKTLNSSDMQKNTLQEEMDNVKLYLDIEKIRFGDKFTLAENLSDNCKELMVPSMLLQPIFENAIKHGVYESIDKVEIKINCFKEKEYMKIIVENNFDEDAVHHKGEGIGLKNIQNRLKIIYNQENLLSYSKKGGIFMVTIYIPL